MRIRTSTAAAALLGLTFSLCRSALALNPALDVREYAHTAWKNRDGFAKGPIISIAQTPDGYLWLATEFGLLRFDGVRAVPWRPPAGQLPSNFILCLLVSRDGTLWIGTLKGLASWKDGKFADYPEFARAIIQFALEGRDQTVWFSRWEVGKARLCTIRAGRVECDAAGSFGDSVHPLYEDRKANLWVASQTGLWRWAPGAPKRYALPTDVIEINALIEDDAGALLVATSGGLKQLVAGKIENYPLAGMNGHFLAKRFLRSRDGSLWVGTDQGLLHAHQGRVDRFSALDGLSGDSVDDIFEDREGNVWVATADGLDRFRDYAVPTISQNFGLSHSVPGFVQATADGSIWIGTPDRLSRWRDGRSAVYSGLAGSLRSLGLDDEGRLWAATTEGGFYFERGRFIRALSVPGGDIFSVAGDGHGNIWSLQGDRLSRWFPNAAVEQVALFKIGQTRGRTMLADVETGGVWLAFYQGGLEYMQDGKIVRSYGAADGLGDGRIFHLRFGSNGSVWASTEGGLSWVRDGHVATMTQKNGLPCDEVHWSVEDNDNNAWLYLPCGLVRIASSELNAWVGDPQHVLKTTVFDDSDGVQSTRLYAANGPHVTKSPDGKIWFVVRDGVSVIDPWNLPINTVPPSVHIEGVTADGKTYDATNGLRVPPLVRDLTIDYTALSLVAAEKMRFRYKLEGQDADWREVVSERHVQYSNLAPGAYRFRVTASNNSGVWNETGASFDFSIAPAYYQTTWFRATLGGAALVVLWAVHQFRLRRVAYDFDARLQARVNERTRIARDLHDTLLQSFHGVMFRFQAAANVLPDRPLEAKQRLETALKQGTHAIREGRDAVQGLRDSTAVTNDVAVALRAVGEELAATEVDAAQGRTATVDVAIQGTPRVLRPIIRDDIYRIGSEALRNAFRHAHARRIEVEIRYDAGQFQLRVRDDGQGIDAGTLDAHCAGHFGLPGMRERAEQIGGHLEVWSEVGMGTEVALTIPGATIYASPRTRRHFWSSPGRRAHS